MGGVLDNLPFPKSYLLIALAAIILAILIAVGVSTCSSSQPEEQESQANTEQAAQQQDGNQINADIPEDLRWRDTDFAVDPSRTTWSNKDNGRKVVYLTIDDGPSKLTEQYLDVFDKYNCKVTFFVTGQNPEYYDLIHEAYKRGHTIGLHSMTHKYDQIYQSEDAFYTDLDAIGQLVKEQIGYVPCFIRFPGGSSNTQANDYSKGLMEKLVEGVQKRGYQYIDWSAATGDADGLTTEQIIQTVKDSELDTNVVLLCHDSATNQATLDALPTIIEYYQALGYTFEAYDRDTWACHHTVYKEEGTTGDTDSTSNAGGVANASSNENGQQNLDGDSEVDDTTNTYEDSYEESYDETYVESYEDSTVESYDETGAEESYADEGENNA